MKGFSYCGIGPRSEKTANQEHGHHLGGNLFSLLHVGLYLPYPNKTLCEIGSRIKFFVQAGDVVLRRSGEISTFSSSIFSNMRYCAGIGTDFVLPFIGSIELNYIPYIKYKIYIIIQIEVSRMISLKNSKLDLTWSFNFLFLLYFNCYMNEKMISKFLFVS